MTLEKAIETLRPIVKMSHIKNQAHIDLSLAPAHDLEKYQQALVVTKQAVIQNIISQNDLNEKLGL